MVDCQCLFVLTAVGGWELGMKMSSLLFYRFSFSTGGEINGWFSVFFGGGGEWWMMVFFYTFAVGFVLGFRFPMID